jgi:hypothetical protein
LSLVAVCPGLVCENASASAIAGTPAGQKGFLDFVLKQINPREVDYGARLEAARRLWVERSLANPFFWALIVAVGLLLVAFCVVAHQHGEKMRRELIASTLLAQYHNGWLEARNRAEEAIARHGALVNAANQTRDKAAEDELRSRAEWMGEQDKESQASPSPTEMFLSSGYHGIPARESKPAARRRPAPEPDMAAQVSTLQQQLNASVAREQSLERELEKSAVRVQAAKPKREA